MVCSEGQINAACCHRRDSSTPSNAEQMDHRGLVGGEKKEKNLFSTDVANSPLSVSEQKGN